MPDREVTGTFTMKTIKRLHMPTCESSEQYSYNGCLRSYVQRTTNCSIDVFSNKYNCTSEGLANLFVTLDKLKLFTKRTTAKITGCLPKCTSNQYSFTLSKEEDSTLWRKDWISSFYLSSKTTRETTVEQNYSYDEQVELVEAIMCHNPDYNLPFKDLIGAVGGYLGLFLGWSVMSIVTAAPTWITQVTGLVCKVRETA